jgi:DNA-binding XRE family transcriptional regulator
MTAMRRPLAALRLRSYRLSAEVTSAALARRLGIARETLCRLESGKRAPSLRLAVEIERVTGGAVRPGDWRRRHDGEEM